MSVFRQDAATGGWVIIAPSRRARPHEVIRTRETEPASEQCPLCPGHETETPPELFRLPAGDQHWAVRAVPNKFAVVTPRAEIRERRDDELLRELDGVGHHEVIVETPRHGVRTADMTEDELATLFEAYHARYQSVRSNGRVAYVIIFKNLGERAGASLAHPHSQLVTTPMGPPHLEVQYARARAHHEQTGRCLYGDMVSAELRDKRRVVVETDHFVAFCPFASGVAYETWIVPKRHEPSYANTTSVERGEAARTLRSAMRAIDGALDRPDYNYVLHTAAVANETVPFYSWHLQILPRTATFAGFELGSGIPINTVSPEEAAAQLRQHATEARQR